MNIRNLTDLSDATVKSPTKNFDSSILSKDATRLLRIPKISCSIYLRRLVYSSHTRFTEPHFFPESHPNFSSNVSKVCRNFSLVELLIVISIIAVLVGILLPALHSSREKAREIACASNIKQVYIGISGYINDNNDAIAPAFGNRYGSMVFYIWEYVTGKTLEGVTFASKKPLSSFVFACPSTTYEVPVFTSGGVKGYYNYDAYRFSYAGTCDTSIEYSSTHGIPGYVYKIQQVRNPTRKVASVETTGTLGVYSSRGGYMLKGNYLWGHGIMRHGGGYFDGALAPYSDWKGLFQLPARGKGNYLYYDGHTGSMSFHDVNTREKAKKYFQPTYIGE